MRFKTFMLWMLVLNVFQSNGQDSSSVKFKTIEFAEYDVNSPRIQQKDKVEIYTYASLDEKGNLKVLFKRYNGEIRYYAYQLSDSIINGLNQIFNGGHLLQHYMVESTLKDGNHFAGTYNYIGYTLTNGKKDELCYVGLYMSKDFDHVMDKLMYIIYRQPKTEIAPGNLIPADLPGKILFQHKKNTYLPAIESAPPVSPGN